MFERSNFRIIVDNESPSPFRDTAHIVFIGRGTAEQDPIFVGIDSDGFLYLANDESQAARFRNTSSAESFLKSAIEQEHFTNPTWEGDKVAWKNPIANAVCRHTGKGEKVSVSACQPVDGSPNVIGVMQGEQIHEYSFNIGAGEFKELWNEACVWGYKLGIEFEPPYGLLV